MLFVGNDWAEDHHDVEVVDEQGRGWPGDGYRKVWTGSPAACVDRAVLGRVGRSNLQKQRRGSRSGSRPNAVRGCRR